MKIETDRGGRITISADASLLARFLALCGLGTIVGAFYMWATGPVETKALVGAGIGAAIAAGRRIDAVAIACTLRGLDLTAAKNLVDRIAGESRRSNS
ncbi:MAG: hypothetical protein ACREEE_01135 [Dongiaceae bacterium]